MAEKLTRSPARGALGVRVATPAYVPCYGATMSYYGSVPATFAAGDADAFPFLIITDASNLEAMIESETRTGNYDVYLSDKENENIVTGMPVYAFVCHFGPLHLDGDICRLSEFQSDPTAGLSQSQMIMRLLGELGYSLSVEQFAEKVSDKQFWAKLRDQVRERFASAATLQGFDRFA